MKTCKKEGILPVPFGIVSRRNDDEIVRLSHSGIGDKYAGALSECIKARDYSHIIDLKETNLTNEGAKKIIDSIKPDTRELDFGFNA